MLLYKILYPIAWVLAHIFFRPEILGRENLIKDRGFIIAPNHRSALDPVFVILSDWYFWQHPLRIFAKKELFEGRPLLGWFLRQMGAVPVKTGRGDLSTIEQTVQECRNGRGLLLFPEGTRCPLGRAYLQPKSGAFVVADEAQVDMIPCRIFYDARTFRPKLFHRLRICYGEPFTAEQLSLGGKHNMAKLRENKQLLLDSWKAMAKEHNYPGYLLNPKTMTKEELEAYGFNKKKEQNEDH